MENNGSVKINKTDDGGYVITFDPEYINTADRPSIKKMVDLLTTSIFMPLENDNVIQKESVVKDENSKNTKEHIAIFMDMLSHYTGGRYSIFHQVVLLGEYYNVDVIVDSPIPFKDDFVDYPGYDNVKIIVDSQFLSSSKTNKYKYVIGVPNVSAQYAYEYCKKFDVKFLCYMFESPNFVSKYRDGIDSTEEYWKSFKIAITNADVKLSPSKLSSKYLKEWIGSNGTYKVIYPCINTLVAKKAKKIQSISKSESIVYVSRMASHKNPLQIFRMLDRGGRWLGTIHVIGKIWDSKLMKDVVYQNINVIFHDTVSDIKKFNIIKSCKLMIFPSKFEGYGMPPMEALYLGIPVIAYRLPVLEEIYNDAIEYVDGGPKEFVKEIISTLSRIKNDNVKISVPQYSEPFYTKEKLLDALSSGKNKITVGIIALNAMDYLPTIVKNIYDHVDQIIIVEGAVKDFGYKNTNNWHSTDGTYEWLTDDDKLYDPYGKISIVVTDRPWANKIEMQNQIASRVNGDIYIKMDSDEVWDISTLNDVVKYMSEHRDVDIIKMPFVHLWTSFNYEAKDAGGKWGTKHPRVWRWRNGFRHLKSFNYFVDTRKDNRNVSETYYRVVEWNGGSIYHFGYVRTKQRVDEKLYYYKSRGIEKTVDVHVYDKWEKLGDRTQPTQNVRSWAVEFDKHVLPHIIRKHPYWDIYDVRRVQ